MNRCAEQRGARQQRRSCEDHAARPEAVDQDSRDRRQEALDDRRDRLRARREAARPVKFVDERHQEYRERKVETVAHGQRYPDDEDDRGASRDENGLAT